ncbi:MazG-like nucleotide pyrophosphohydrolase [Arthrobacter phage Thunderclap]|uniref:MazG-like nucleotide pyrophosphohydrolase n=4 Tax=Amigovirus amigo TaxID=1982100 RepID=A0A0U4B6S4_9CAUD|nr:MazG-like nucleotide pyrophosphohydrolase [Arthrobacter phage Anansi]ALY09133.1 MazG-like nucleotide pyrophosphohydrolase [Arthrobacter phage Gorgeous]ALY10414.1 MazG-like nucleotide pyrophosphohydrolase [Arthrobacter phage SorJuana]QOR56129.1 MazG-like nucleotide pyrophosphohydrolase [Arthrobacter phage Thunderclap]
MTISLNEYQNEAMRTAIYPEDRGLEYTTLGLLSEVGELNGAWLGGTATDILSELGDNYWYVAAIAHSLGEQLENVLVFANIDESVDFRPLDELFQLLTYYSGEIAGVVKKSIRDNDGQLTPEKYDKVIDLLANVLHVLDTLTLHFDGTPAGVQAKNLDKLADRQRRNVLGGSGDHR